MIRGELYWVNFPESDGHEQSGFRPVVVVQDDSNNRRLKTVLVVPITGQAANIRFPGAVAINPSQSNNLLKPSVILVHQIRAIDLRRFGRQIGVVEPSIMTAIMTGLDLLTGRATGPAPPPADPA